MDLNYEYCVVPCQMADRFLVTPISPVTSVHTQGHQATETSTALVNGQNLEAAVQHPAVRTVPYEAMMTRPQSQRSRVPSHSA